MPLHRERHLVERIGWLRAAILGANDGIVSTASLIVGVAAAAARPSDILLTGIAGLVAGAMSMAAGEYVSVSSQSDTEAADLEREADELAADPEAEVAELTAIYVRRGLTDETAAAVARQLTAHDALAAHAHDELGLVPGMKARPVQAALTSAVTFSAGAGLPLLIALGAPPTWVAPAVATGALVSLAGLGAIGAAAGGAGRLRAAGRVAIWGALAMAVTSAVGAAVGASL
ncbi:VIT family protein [Brevundimonas sp.]|uniref:VIT1/CCC1 transporter family protein n=1 Tax=Brevundimonas sp. TaxID=1871086 RepID=UPI002737E296|nr:VIT family protein [Brevundimonas sp.]MDP3801957.1 VIT family protein [Brevundimonas sp.]